MLTLPSVNAFEALTSQAALYKNVQIVLLNVYCLKLFLCSIFISLNSFVTMFVAT